MKKKIAFLIVSIFLLEFLNITNWAIGFDNILYNLEVNKEEYYMNEEIKVNASWQLNYDPINEKAYVQIRMYDSLTNKIVWNSSKYNVIGSFTENWSINILHLNMTMTNNTSIVFIKFFSYHWQIGIGGDNSFLETIEVKIVKRIPLCRVTGLKERLNFGENLTLSVTFYDAIIENNTFFSNQLVWLMISSNNSKLYQHNFTTNQFGTIEIIIYSQYHLNYGVNSLQFSILNNLVYNNSIFQYQIFLEKNRVFTDLVLFKDILNRHEDLEIKLFYYFFNNSLKPLKNESIKLVIYNNQDVIFSKIYSTDEFGILFITISLELFNFSIERNELKLILKYDGSHFLENKSVILGLNINPSTLKNGMSSNVLVFIPFLIIFSLILFFLWYKYRRVQTKMLTEIIFKY